MHDATRAPAGSIAPRTAFRTERLAELEPALAAGLEPAGRRGREDGGETTVAVLAQRR